MPLYEYTCRKCSKRFEQLLYGKEKPSCPGCRGTDLEKMFSTFATSGRGDSGSDSFGGGDLGGGGDDFGGGADGGDFGGDSDEGGGMMGSGGGCGSCGDPRGPGSCAVN